MNKRGMIFTLDVLIAIMIMTFFVMINSNQALYFYDNSPVYGIQYADEISQLLQREQLLTRAVELDSTTEIETFFNQTLAENYCASVHIYDLQRIGVLDQSSYNCTYNQYLNDDLSVSYISVPADNTLYYAKISLWLKSAKFEIVPFESCYDILQSRPTATNGTYRIDPDRPNNGTDPFTVYCDMETDGGGWTLVTRAIAGQVSHQTESEIGTVVSPSQSTVAKLSHQVIHEIGVIGNKQVYETRFLADNFADEFYFEWNNGHATQFNTSVIPISGSIAQTRKTSFAALYINETVAYQAGCAAAFRPFADLDSCNPIWGYFHVNPGQCHSGFGLQASCVNPWVGLENNYHRNGTMWVR